MRPMFAIGGRIAAHAIRPSQPAGETLPHKPVKYPVQGYAVDRPGGECRLQVVV